jgi:hypothetical protein
MNIAELIVSLGLDDKQFSNKLAKATGKLLLFKEGLRTLGQAFQNLAGETMDYVVHLDKLQQISGINADKFQEWEMRAKLANVSTQDLESSLKGLTSLSGKKTLVNFGMNPNGDVFAQLDAILKKADSIKNVSVRNSFLARFGISPEMLMLLHNSNDELQRFKKLQLNKEDRDNVLKLNQTWELLKLEIALANNKLVAVASKILNPLLSFGQRLYDSIILIGQAIWDKIFIPLSKINIPFGVALAIMWQLFIRLNPIMRLITIIALVIEDIGAYLRGDLSVTGKFIENLQMIKWWINDIWLRIKKWFSDMGYEALILWAKIKLNKDEAKNLEAEKDLKNAKYDAERLKSMIEVAEKTGKDTEPFEAALSSNPYIIREQQFNLLLSGFNSFKDVIKKEAPKYINDLMQTSNNITNSNNRNNTINIYSSANPIDIANEVKSRLDRENSYANMSIAPVI